MASFQNKIKMWERKVYINSKIKVARIHSPSVMKQTERKSYKTIQTNRKKELSASGKIYSITRLEVYSFSQIPLKHYHQDDSQRHQVIEALWLKQQRKILLSVIDPKFDELTSERVR